MIAIIRNGEMYLYDDAGAFYADENTPKNKFIMVSVINNIHNRSTKKVLQ